jgi:chromosome segregation ATPase
LLELARTAVENDPDIRVAEFRAAHGVGSNEAQAVLRAAWWERGYRQYGRLTLEDLHPRYRSLVKPPASQDPACDVTIDTAPDALRLEIERALAAARDAMGSMGDHLQLLARRVIVEVEAGAVRDVRAAESATQELATEIEVAQRQEAEARRETASIREELNSELSRLTQELRDQTRERVAADRAREVAEEDRRQAHAMLERGRETMARQTADLSTRLADAERVVGATERLVQTLTETNADLRRRLDEAVEALAGARRDTAVAESKAAASEARLLLLDKNAATVVSATISNERGPEASGVVSVRL